MYKVSNVAEERILDYLSNLSGGKLGQNAALCDNMGLREVLGGVNPRNLLVKLQADLYNESVIKRRQFLIERINVLIQEIRGLEESKQKQRLENTSFAVKSKIIKDESYPDGYKLIYKKRRDPNHPDVIAQEKIRKENAKKNRERKERIAKSKLEKMYN